MASTGDDESIVEKLKQKVDTRDIQKREQEINARIHSQYEKQQERLGELIGSNSTLPVTISSVRVLGATHTRRGFLERIFNPILSINKSEPYTLNEAIAEIASSADKLDRFGIFKSPISVYIDKPDQTDPNTTPTDLAVFLSAHERGKYTIKTGTEAGHAEGSAYLNVILRNIFGGAEALNANASLGTRTRSAYSAFFDTPILSNPNFNFEIGGLANTTLKSFASHEELLKGGSARFRYTTPSRRHKHELTYQGLWRQITGLAENASPTVRADAGDSFKSSITHTWTRDTRDLPLLPTRGSLLRTVSELAGIGPLKGDVAFGKLELDTQTAVPVQLYSTRTGEYWDSGISLTAGLRAGLLYPLSSGYPGSSDSKPQHSRLNDRFQLGGPTDVRGFRLSGLGPRDGPDAVGGDVYAAGGASILFPFPRVGKDTPLRFQAFVNGGRLLALKDVRSDVEKEKDGEGGMSSRAVAQSVRSTVQELRNELPSCAAGVGVVYAHPVARFELNFSLPLVVRRGEEGRKGLTFGVGISFL
ncbi:hypothetical protein EV356DRAFT_569349 [Viridothelium virens]|uniref:Bacterial surface antigen (D15) domain-containing protein n=1 Tax=Viridothelium virens TaxID=1048519 RepID=A0A6A6H0Q6_VIRVR|nr:hypothetical protein EV356DRAFT_569349 [Viridothelium virens]